jgi:hypothetical protein
MNDQKIREAGQTAYPKANQMLRGDTSLNTGNFTDDELKSILLTIDGVGRKFKGWALDELIERAEDKARDAMMPPM